MQDQIPAVEDTFIPPEFGLLEFVRKVRQDQLSVLTPNIYHRRLISFRMFRGLYFVLNWPDYIEHVLLTNSQNYVKGRFSEALVGPIGAQARHPRLTVLDEKKPWMIGLCRP